MLTVIINWLLKCEFRYIFTSNRTPSLYSSSNVRLKTVIQMMIRPTYRFKLSNAICSLSARTIGSPRRLPSEVVATVTVRTSEAISTSKWSTKMKSIRFTAPNLAKQNVSLYFVRKLQLRSEVSSSESALVKIIVCLTHRQKRCQR